MQTAKATLKNFRQAPRKMRLVANLVRGKKVSDALVNLDFTIKKAGAPIKTLISSALANAKTLEMPIENLVVKAIRVDSGKILYRRLPASRGSAHPMRKRTSQITVELGYPESKSKSTEKTEDKKIVKETKEVKKPVVKKTVKKTTKKTTN